MNFRYRWVNGKGQEAVFSNKVGCIYKILNKVGRCMKYYSRFVSCDWRYRGQ